VEMLSYVLRLNEAQAAKYYPEGMFEGVVLLAPLVLLFYAAPVLAALGGKGRYVWLLGPILGVAPGLLAGFAAGTPVYGATVGFVAGLASTAIQRLQSNSRRDATSRSGESAA
jgi:hypothetical protein